MSSDAPGLGVEGVLVVDVIVIPVPRTTRRIWPVVRGEGGSEAVESWPASKSLLPELALCHMSP